MPDMDQDRFSLYQTHVQTNVGFTSFMTAVVVFFTGLLLASYRTYDESIKVPISYLIISVFGFLYSTLIYTNSAEEVSHKREAAFKKSMFLGDVISEYLGVYLLVISIPMVVGAVTNDLFLRAVTIISSLAGLMLYQFSHVSMIERHFRKEHKILAFLALLFGLALFTAQIYHFYFVQIATLYIIFVLLITYMASRLKNFSNP